MHFWELLAKGGIDVEDYLCCQRDVAEVCLLIAPGLLTSNGMSGQDGILCSLDL